MSADLDLALELADIADPLAMARFRAADLHIETKPDMTPVTDADRAIETALRETLAKARPGDAIIGEEFGHTDGSAARRWIIDPIDATKNFVRGIPVFATLIGLEVDGRIDTGVVSAPALGRRWWAARGEGAFLDGEPIRVSAIARLGEAQLLYPEVELFAGPGQERFLDLAERCWRSRGFGDFWQHMLVAQGSAEIALEPEVSLWDMAAVQVIVEEAGGRFTDLAGIATAAGGNALSTNGLLHDEVLGLISPA